MSFPGQASQAPAPPLRSLNFKRTTTVLSFVLGLLALAAAVWGAGAFAASKASRDDLRATERTVGDAEKEIIRLGPTLDYIRVSLDELRTEQRQLREDNRAILRVVEGLARDDTPPPAATAPRGR